MHTLTRAVGLMMVVATTSLTAQGAGEAAGAPPGRGMGMMPGPGMAPGGPVGATADFLLAHTGDLALTDAQVVRLAAISRRTDARRKTMLARMDSARASARPARGDSAGPRGRGPRPPLPDEAQMRQAREQIHADIRDAIAVLTPDQQATAWMMVAGGPPPGARALGGPRGPMGRPRGAGSPDDAADRNLDRGPISRPPPARDVPRRPDDSARTEP